MKIVPLTLAQANSLVSLLHRHHKPAQGHRFSIGVIDGDKLVGAAIIGRPVSRELDPYSVAEVVRLVTDGTKNACSFLYSAAARIAREMGFEKIQTYILEDEPGTSLIASGWIFETTTNGGDWNHSKKNAGKRRTDQPMCRKQRYGKQFLENVKLGNMLELRVQESTRNEAVCDKQVALHAVSDKVA